MFKPSCVPMSVCSPGLNSLCLFEPEPCPPPLHDSSLFFGPFSCQPNKRLLALCLCSPVWFLPSLHAGPSDLRCHTKPYLKRDNVLAWVCPHNFMAMAMATPAFTYFKSHIHAWRNNWMKERVMKFWTANFISYWNKSQHSLLELDVGGLTAWSSDISFLATGEKKVFSASFSGHFHLYYVYF